ADGTVLTLKDDIPLGHKIAISPIQEGEHVYKFGYSIGQATTAIEQGQWVHTHNLKTGLKGTLAYSYNPNAQAFAEASAAATASTAKEKTFQGYIRENGDVGIRNEIWIIN